MLIYDLEQRDGKSKYEYLYQCLKEDILNGKLAEGEKMPSKEQLAKENGISVRTVINAPVEDIILLPDPSRKN